jgi:hypothetical protein
MLLFHDDAIGNFRINLEELEVINQIQWEKVWRMCGADPEEFADCIGEIFDTYYDNYNVEHDFEPSLYAEELGNFKVTLTTETAEYELWVNLDRPSHIIEVPTFFHIH